MTKRLLDQVRDVAREEATARRDDDAWIRRARGDLTAAEEEALLAHAEDPGEAALLAAMTAPRSEAAEDALLDRALQAAGAVRTAPSGPILTKRSARVRWIAPLVAAAAAVAIYVGARGNVARPLPAYEIALEGIDAEQRAPSPAPAPGVRGAVSPGAHLVIVLRPSVAVSAPVAAAAFVATGDRASALPVSPKVAPSGTVTIEGTREALFGDERGAVDLVVWVGAPERLPPSPSEARSREPPADGAAVRLVVPLTLR